MNPIVEINETVDITATFTKTKNRVHVMPSHMDWRGRQVCFTQLGLCHPVHYGGQLHYVFDVSDGLNDYSLDFDTTTLTWTLVSVIDGGSLC